jgi:hypothetical protein
VQIVGGKHASVLDQKLVVPPDFLYLSFLGTEGIGSLTGQVVFAIELDDLIDRCFHLEGLEHSKVPFVHELDHAIVPTGDHLVPLL